MTKYSPEQMSIYEAMKVCKTDQLYEILHISTRFDNVIPSIAKSIKKAATNKNTKIDISIDTGFSLDPLSRDCIKSSSDPKGYKICFMFATKSKMIELGVSADEEKKVRMFCRNYEDDPKSICIVIPNASRDDIANDKSLESLLSHELRHGTDQFLSNGTVFRGSDTILDPCDNGRPYSEAIIDMLYHLSDEEMRGHANAACYELSKMSDEKLRKIISNTPSSLPRDRMQSLFNEVDHLLGLQVMRQRLRKYERSLRDEPYFPGVSQEIDFSYRSNAWYECFKLGYYGLKSKVFDKNDFSDDRFVDPPFRNMNSIDAFLYNDDCIRYVIASKEAFANALSKYEKMIAGYMIDLLKKRNIDC